MVKVKFCGLKRDCDIAWANALQPAYVGFVFAGKKRRLSPEQARHLRQLLLPPIAAVGVFVDAPVPMVADLAREGTIQLAQLHGHEDEAYIQALRHLTAVPLIQAFTIRDKGDIERAERSQADYILLDSGPGGTGETFDWSCLRAVRRPWFLAGGLSPDNVGEALRLKPYAVDVSSGIETEGVKDRKKMARFMEIVHSKEDIR